jgi:TetR/AcrR family transcriptional repressor of nem operon
MPRIKQFDPDKAVDQAMHLFWARGYEATSIQEIVQTLGINRFSLYGAFGDKHGLFMECIKRYTDHVFVRSIYELEHDEGGLAAIERYFQKIARWAAKPKGKHGCLLVNAGAERASVDRVLNKHLRQQYTRAEEAFLMALRRAEQLGELRPQLELRDRARSLVLLVHGCLLNMKSMRDSEWVLSVGRTLIEDLRERPSEQTRAR